MKENFLRLFIFFYGLYPLEKKQTVSIHYTPGYQEANKFNVDLLAKGHCSYYEKYQITYYDRY